jgi:nitrogenase molybdenum-iron protein alpha/beta subunit
MQDNCNVPYLKLPVPVGVKNTTKFLRGLIDYFDLPRDNIEKLKYYENFVYQRLQVLNKFLSGKKIAVAVGANRTLYLVEALIELGLDIKVISFYRIHETVGNQVLDISGKTFKKLSKLIQKYDLDCEVLMYSDSKQFWEVVTQQKVDIVFDVHTNRKLIHNMGMAFSESMDVVQPYQFYYGFLSLAYDLVKELNQPFYRKYKEFCK